MWKPGSSSEKVVGLSWTSRFVLRANFRACPHTQLNINESVSTARKARPGGTAIYGIKAIGQPSDASSATSAGVADTRASRVQNTKGIRPLDVNQDMSEDNTSRDMEVTMMPPGRVLAVSITCLPVPLHPQPQSSSRCPSQTPSTLRSPETARQERRTWSMMSNNLPQSTKTKRWTICLTKTQ